MRTFLRGRWARVIAQALTLTFLWSVAFLGLPVLPARAQIAMRTATAQSVAVVPFDNRSHFGDETLGQEAAQAVTVELRERLLLDVLPSADVELEMHDLDLKAPLSDSELIRLASELEVTTVVTGEVRSVELRNEPDGRRARVTLAVLVFDRVAEDTVNGALVEVVGPAMTNADDAAVVRKALEQAAFEAVREMRTHPTITATVLWNREDTVYVSAGSRAGLTNGTQMAVIRSGQRLGLVEITSADPLGAYAKLVSGPPLRPGDRLRAIYRLPSRAGAPLTQRMKRKKRGIETMLLGAAALLGLADIGSTARLLEQGNTAAPGFRASNLANGFSNGHSAPNFPAVLLTWEDYANAYESSRLIGYEIWADPGYLVTVITTSMPLWYDRYYIQDWSIPPETVYKTLEITIDTTTGADTVDLTSTTLGPDDDPSDVDIGITEEDTQDDITYVYWVTPPSWGVPVQYRIRPIVAKQDIDGYWTIDRGTELSTGQIITPIPPPFTSNVYFAGMTATFEFYSPYGADQGIIQIARGPEVGDFSPDRVYEQRIDGLWTDYMTYGRQLVDVDLNNVIGLPGSGDVYWYRIGCRNSDDTTYPRPYPLDRTEDNGWVWSDVQQFSVVAPSRDLALRRERDALARSLSSRSRVMNRTRRDRPLHIH